MNNFSVVIGSHDFTWLTKLNQHIHVAGRHPGGGFEGKGRAQIRRAPSRIARGNCATSP